MGKYGTPSFFLGLQDILNRKSAYDGVGMMVDIRLGPLLGVELAEWALLRQPNLPVIFMSAYPYGELEGRIRRISPHPVLEKPFDVTDVGRMMEHSLQTRD